MFTAVLTRESIMLRIACAGLVIVSLCFVAGCRARRAEVEKLRRELEDARAELKALREQKPAENGQGARKEPYIEELEELLALKSNKALTEEEFLDRKRAVLEELIPRPLEETDKRLRDLDALRKQSAITPSEARKAKAKLLKRPVRVADLKEDVERARALMVDQVITPTEHRALKGQILQLGADK
jgi:hypothetical protein